MRGMTQTMKRQTLSRFTLTLLAASTLVACSGGEKPRETATATLRGIQVETVRRRAVPEIYAAVGTVRSATTSLVGAQISGTVLEIRVNPGDRVKRGQLLAVLDDRDSRAQLDAAQAGVEEAAQGRAEVEQALEAAAVERQFAEATYRR